MYISNCCILTCIQISQDESQVVWNPHLFKNFPQFIVIHIVKGFTIVNKAEIDVFLGEGNGNPLQYSCLENPTDRGAWWAAVYGVAQSRTRLKRLSSSNTVKGFGMVNKTELGIFLELLCFFNDPTDVGNLNSGSSLNPA